MAVLTSNRERWLVWVVGLGLVLGTVACYWPVRHFDYVNLDDPLYVYQAPMVQHGLTWAGTAWAFHNVEGGNWNPLVWLSHMLDCQIYGMPAGGHHVTNVILHTVNVLLLFLVLRGMTGTLWRSGLAAALFAWHPLHVESVAWVSERKDVLSTLFWLLTMWAYARYAREFKIKNAKAGIYYVLALGFFVLGLMSKPMLVTLPVVLLLLDFWPLKRIGKGGNIEQPTSNIERPMGEGTSVSLIRALVEKVPFLILSAGASVVAMWAQEKLQAVVDQALMLRLENAVVSCATYVLEFFWPVKLAVFYPYPDSIATWRAIGATAILGMMTGWIIWQGRERRYLAVGWLWFLVTLLPVIGLVQVGMQAMADRYTYVPYIGLGLMVSWGLADLAGMWPRLRVAAGLTALAGLAACATVTVAQVSYWQNSTTLYGRAVAVTSGNYMAHDNMGYVLEDQGKLDGAVKEFQEVIRLTPEIAKPYNDLGKAYILKGDMDNAMLMFSNAARLNPGLAQARWNLGNVWLRKGKVAEGLEEMKKGVELSPDDVEAHQRLGDTLIRLGKAAEAMPYCEMVVKAEPTNARARLTLGTAYLAQRQVAKATIEFKEAVRLAPESPPCLNSLAWVYATSPEAKFRNGAEAVRLAGQACALTKRQDAGLLDTLAAVYAEAGRFGDAVKTAEEARAVANAAHDSKMAEMEQKQVELYKAGKPFRDGP